MIARPRRLLHLAQDFTSLAFGPQPGFGAPALGPDILRLPQHALPANPAYVSAIVVLKSVTLQYQLDGPPVFVVVLRRYTTSCRDTLSRFTNRATKGIVVARK